MNSLLLFVVVAVAAYLWFSGRLAAWFSTSKSATTSESGDTGGNLFTGFFSKLETGTLSSVAQVFAPSSKGLYAADLGISASTGLNAPASLSPSPSSLAANPTWGFGKVNPTRPLTPTPATLAALGVISPVGLIPPRGGAIAF